MKLISMKITDGLVSMTFADNAVIEQSAAWITFQVPVADLRLGTENGEVPLGDIEKRSVAEVRLAALRRVRDEVGGEIQRLSSQRDRTA